MKCPSCGAENRPDVRFCRKCGQPMQGATPPPSEPPPQSQEAQPPAGPVHGTGVVCPSCGANVKPGARFCPRCGQSIQAGGEPQPPPDEAQPSPGTGPQRYVQPPQPVPPTEQPAAAPAGGGPQPVSAPPPSAKKSGPPLWMWLVGGFVLLVIIGGGAFGAWYLFLRDTEGEADATPTPTITATSEEVVSTDPTATPTPPSTATPEPTATTTPDGLSIDVAHAVLPDSPRVGTPLALTVFMTNTGEVPIEITDIQLLKAWREYLDQLPSPDVGGVIEPGQSRTTIFNFTAREPGEVTIQLLVIGDVMTEPRTTEQRLSEPFSFTITE